MWCDEHEDDVDDPEGIDDHFQLLCALINQIEGILMARRIGNECNLNEEGTEKDYLPKEVKAARSWVLDNNVALAPIARGTILLIIVTQLLVVVFLLEEKLHEVFVLVPKFEVWLHVTLIKVLTQNLSIPPDALFFLTLLHLLRLASASCIDVVFIALLTLAAPQVSHCVS